MVTKTYRQEKMAQVIPTPMQLHATPAAETRPNAQAFVMSAGGGLKLAWNENFILSVELAHCLKPAGMGGNLWLNISTNYSF